MIVSAGYITAFYRLPGQGGDLGYSFTLTLDTLRITVAEENLRSHIIEGESLTDIVHQFRQLVGRSYIPPKWAFGNARAAGATYERGRGPRGGGKLPCQSYAADAVVLDIDYMEHYKDFTVDAQRFPRFADFAAEMKAQGIHLVPIIDAAVRSKMNMDVYERA